MWYRREESQKRFTFFFMSTAIAGAFGGLLASAIGKMDGMQGMRGWRWIFILGMFYMPASQLLHRLIAKSAEGIMTTLISGCCYFIQPDFPEDVKWLSEEERALVKRRLEEDVGDSGRDEKITPKLVLQQFKSLQFILGGFMYLGVLVPAYGYSFFGPTILNSFGYSRESTHQVSPSPAQDNYADHFQRSKPSYALSQSRS